MPIYEYVCTDCEQTFEKLVRSSASALDVTCPDCGSTSVNKKISTFATSIKGATSSASTSAASCSTGGL